MKLLVIISGEPVGDIFGDVNRSRTSEFNTLVARAILDAIKARELKPKLRSITVEVMEEE